MNFIPVTDVWQCSLKGSTQGVPTVMTFYELTDGVPLTQVYADFLSQQIEAAFDASMLEAAMSSQSRWDTLTVTDLTSAVAPQFVSTNQLPIVGLSGSAPLPAMTQSMIEWTTSLRGRSYRGRTFVPGGTTADGVDAPTGAHQTILSDFATDILAFLTPGGDPHLLGPSVVSRFSGTHDNVSGHGSRRRLPTPRAFGIATPITGFSIETVYKTLRRRAVAG